MRTIQKVKSETQVNNEMLTDVSVKCLDHLKSNTRHKAFELAIKYGSIFKVEELFIDTRKEPSEYVLNDEYLLNRYNLLREDNRSLYMVEIRVLEED